MRVIAVRMFIMGVGMTIVIMAMIFMSVHVRMRPVLMDRKALMRRIQDIFMRVCMSIRGTRL